MKKTAERAEIPELARYTRYYEHDGMLRAYANRSMALAMIFGVLAMGSLAFAIYVRLQPPTVHIGGGCRLRNSADGSRR
jgi:hypothetical protein